MFVCAALVPAVVHSKTMEVDVSEAPLPVAPNLNRVNTVISADAAWLLRVFRELHDDSQVGRIEARFAGTIASELVGRGFEIAFGADGTEVVATLHNGPGPTLVYRADTGSDVMPALERRSHASQASSSLPPQPAHGCGNDASVAWMLGMAKALVTLREQWAGTLVLASQPTRLLRNGEPNLERPGSAGRRMPKADMVLALSAAPSPLGSILSIRGQRRAGAEAAEFAVSRTGVYEDPQNVDQVTQLAASTTRLYGLPEDALFGYLLVGIATRELGELTSELDAAGFDATDPSVGIDLAAIPLGAKLATVAVLELLDKATPPRRDGPAAPAREWTRHNY
jgi:hypothetical protein